MGVYRLELASSGRAVCKNTECKKNGVKILKGELRFCSQVDIQGKQSWAYKHWGCTTPQQIENLKQSIEDNIEYLDGFEELPSETQSKVLKALEDGHVGDDEWKGDVTQNRLGSTKFRSPAPKKKQKAKEDEEEDEDGAPEPEVPVSKKRGRSKKDENVNNDDDEEPPPKITKVKSRKEKKKKANDPEINTTVETDPPQKGQAAATKESGGDEASLEPTPKERRPQRKAATTQKPQVAESDDDMDDSEFEEPEEAEKPKAKKSRKKAIGKGSNAKGSSSKRSKKDVTSNAGTADAS